MRPHDLIQYRRPDDGQDLAEQLRAMARELNDAADRLMRVDTTAAPAPIRHPGGVVE